MKKIVILGSSLAGARAVEKIRAHDQSSEIVLVAFEGQYPYNRDLFFPFICKEIPLEKVFYRPKDFYQKNRVQVLLDKKIARVNTKRNKIFTEDKEQIDYDVLVVSDTPAERFPEIKGTSKTGTFGCRKLKDICAVVEALPLADTVTVQSDTFWGIKTALAILQRGKAMPAGRQEVLLISSTEHILPSVFEPQTAAWVKDLLEKKGLRVLTKDAVTEILGEGDVKAVRLQSGKVMASQMVIFADSQEDFRIFADSPLCIGQKIPVNARLQTNVDNIFALDTTSALEDSTDSSFDQMTPYAVLERQGEIAAAAIIGQDIPADQLLAVGNVSVEGFSLVLLGDRPGAKGHVQEFCAFQPEAGIYKKLCLTDGYVSGAVLINAERDTDQFSRLIGQRVEAKQLEILGMVENTACVQEADAGHSSGEC